ncbi:scarecrow-like protein 14 [Salvia miltiorrhiza]|uniref:scarecrow-like protein 14 n=1 Tax=Salvia miltiorrhiza TaxID=226208 RepID=UPI0025AB7840|nr:scarecrow-like protein 14 [Salvia miltiorrhiza]
MMNGSYKIEGHGPEIWCYDGATSRMRYNSQAITDPSPVDNVGASGSFRNSSHADVIPVSTHTNFEGLVQSSEGDSSVDLDFSDAVLKYINHILLEEDLEEKTFMFRESAALQAAEKSFYEVIGERYPAPRDYQYGSNLDKIVENPDGNLFGATDCSGFYDSGTLCPDWNSDFNCGGQDIYHDAVKRNSQSTSQSSYASSSSSGTQGPIDSPVSTLRIPDIFGDSQSAMQFMKGVEEASKFLPNGNNLVANMGYDGLLPKEGSPNLSVKVENKTGNDEVSDVLRGKKNPYHESMGLQEERSNKQSAVFAESTVSPDMFDRVLLCSGGKNDTALREALNEITRNDQQSGQSKGSNGGKSGGKKKQGKRNVVDMRTLLTLCAQAVAADDRRTANELLKQIRQHASPSGDGMQRLAHYFADGLEARMAGSGTQIYASLLNLPTSAANVLKAYHTYIATCPFRKISNFFSNKTIMKISEKATKLHIIDFGILYGFQWPCFLQRLSNRAGGPPKLRITGIDFPCPGFRPSVRVEETGKCLASYAKTFGVPFEFHAIAQKWETIKLEDLKIEKDETVAVSCLFNLKNLLDETVVVNSPRNMVLNLIRKMNPAVFVLGIKNGSYNAPFFITRFREALFYYSSIFDMLDAIIPRGIPERVLLETILFGREAKNVIACEGAERIERPETYKQWQVRNIRAGFEQLPLDAEITRMARNRVKSSYHKDFVVDEDGQWLLQGWKGRILYASSSWIPAHRNS